MIELHPVTLADKEWMDPLVWAEGSSSADFNFGNIYLWDEAFHQQVGKLNERVIVMPCYHNRPFFAFPVGTGELAPVLAEMQVCASAQGLPLTIRGVTTEHLPLIEALFPGQYTLTCDRNLWDYLYSAEKLGTLSGKHLHSKRNYINRFEAENNWHFASLTHEDFPDCLTLLKNWLAENNRDENPTAAEEYKTICRAFDAYDALGLEGGILRVNEKPVAFTLGEMLCEHTFIVHFEKAYANLTGAYTMINREFVRLVRQRHPKVQWINREDDMGLENLRKAKLSYHPDRMVEKHTVIIEHV